MRKLTVSTCIRSLPVLAAGAFCVVLVGCGPEAQQNTTIPTTAAVATAEPAVSPVLQNKLDSFQNKPITLTFEDKQWLPTAADLGATAAIDGEDLQVSVDEAQVRAYLQRIAPVFELPAANASLQINGLEPVSSPASLGRELDIDTAVEQITKLLQEAEGGQIAVPTSQIVPDVTDSEAQAAQAQVATVLAEPIVVTIGKRTYTLDPAEIAPLITFQMASDGTYRPMISPAQADALLAPLVEASTVPATEPKVAWNDGKLTIFKDGSDGLQLDTSKTLDMLNDALVSNVHELTLPVIALPPMVTAANVNSLGIKEVVSTGKSDFTGSASYRITNVIAGMKLLNGTLIPPGAEFSFNTTVGRIDESNGFVEGYAIVSNRTQLEFGGGICQDSTTVFRAAFWAGLPITERRSHSFYISWYDKYGLGPVGNGAGLDAAIFTGVQDLRFMNDTGSWLLMQASANANSGLAQVTLYGTKPDREVTITQDIVKRSPAITTPEYYADPKQPQGSMKRTDTARGGMYIEVYRTVSQPGQEPVRELFSTSFRPWADKFAVNPADIGADGIPVFLQPTATVTPTTDLEQPTADPNAPPAPTADPNAPPVPTPDPALAPTADPNAPPAPTVDPATLPQPTVDPATLLPTPDPNVAQQPPTDPVVPPPVN